MKRVQLIAGSFVLIFAAVYCTMGALISAFSFGVDTRVLFFGWLIIALVLAIIAAFFRGKGIAILSVPIIIALYLKLPEIAGGAKRAVFHITSEYNKWLNVPIIFPGASASQQELTMFFLAAGVIIALFLSVSICLQRSAFHTIVFTAPFVFLTVVLIETTPDFRLLLGLLAVYLTLLLSRSMHPFNFTKAGNSVFPAILLSVILLGATYLIAPQGSFSRSVVIEDIDSYIRQTAERIGVEMRKRGLGWPGISAGEWRFNTEAVGISSAGSRTITNMSVLNVTSTQVGTFYLRGFSMQRFSGGEWRSNADSMPVLPGSELSVLPFITAEIYSHVYENNRSVSARMTIDKTGESSDIVYRPYYSVASPSQSNPYTVDFYYVKDSLLGLYDALSEIGEVPPLQVFAHSSPPWVNTYTQIEDSTAEGLRELALEAGIDPNFDRAVIADMVAEYISSSARYTLTPYLTPEGEDFALYFLQTSKRGYCIHFATAATLMLRSLDIPARFTSGFVVTVPPGSADIAIDVTDANAHAWVEVYYEGVGWIPLEVTPSRPGSGVPSGTMHSAALPEPFTPSNDVSAEPETQSPERDNPDTTASPSQTTGREEGSLSDDEEDPSQMSTGTFVLIFFSCVAVCLAVVLVRRMIVLKYRETRIAQQDTNAAVICIWRHISRLSRREKPPNYMEELALKARFSQHRISEEERAAMVDNAQEYSADVFARCNLPQRLWLYIKGAK